MVYFGKKPNNYHFFSRPLSLALYCSVILRPYVFALLCIYSTLNSEPYGPIFLAPAEGWEPIGLPIEGPLGPPTNVENCEHFEIFDFFLNF